MASDISKIKLPGESTSRDVKDATARKVFEGATSKAAGVSGQVPAPQAGDEKKVLYGDGTWGEAASGGGDITAVDPGTVTDPVSPYYTKAETNEEISAAKTEIKSLGYQTAKDVDTSITTRLNSKITISTADPTGGSDGDLWFKY